MHRRRRVPASAVPCGLFSALLFLGCGEARRGAYWAADRGAEVLLALDQDLCVLRRVPLSSPRSLAATEQGIWAACAGSRQAGRPDRLKRIAEDGTLAGELAFVGIRDLVACGPQDLLVVDGTSERVGRLWRVDGHGRRRLLLELPRAARAATSASGHLVACEDGELVLLREDGAVACWGELGGPILDLAPGPRAGTWWTLALPGAAELSLLGHDLEPLWTCSTLPGAARLVPLAGEERAWIADGSNARLHGPGGRIEAERMELASGGLQAALTTRNGALFFTPGALLELETCGSEVRLVQTQGGFSQLTALTHVAPGP